MDQMTSSVASVASNWNPLGGAGWGDRVWSQFSPAIDAGATVMPCRPHILTGDVRLHPGFHSQFLPTDRSVLGLAAPGLPRSALAPSSCSLPTGWAEPFGGAHCSSLGPTDCSSVALSVPSQVPAGLTPHLLRQPRRSPLPQEARPKAPSPSRSTEYGRRAFPYLGRAGNRADSSC